ncbi:hypothetical protein Agub_g14293 [Astrephomene gubernaculifera]|uniref:PsbP C-terminal domain-containing protein n=1 Tax=Astrephomene gubernaculifera TaxID=47775 RepID=A0AAD3HTB3_9CHLO|nr:hypothetical protein Agub_g14293 [Astrephomene gubernaculifera]
MLQQSSNTRLSTSHGAFGTGPAPRVSRCWTVARSTAGPGPQPFEVASEDRTLNRRQVLASKLMLAASVLLPSGRSIAADVAPAMVEPGQMKELSDPILAYKFQYPVSTTAGQPLSMLLSRPPEKYSSAAPLTADARQRMVSELFDFRNLVTVSMNVGPASGLLKGRPPSEWSPKEVALAVLIDRSTARTTAGQRVALNDVQEAHAEVRQEGLQYWVYEHMSQGSPTIGTRTRESYRHSLAVTSWRAGLDGTPYLYTLNLSCPESLWPSLEPLFRSSVASFTLLPPSRDYIPPDKDPWLFF